MAAPSYQAEPQIQYLYQLVRDIGEGNLQLPRFQRPYVWTEEQQLELFRSIHTGTPIGTIMLWRTNNQDMKCYGEIGGYELKPPSGPVRTYIIDGHQRLATAFGALHVPPPGVQPDLAAYYDLDVEDFLLAPGAEPPEPCWLPLRFVLNFANLLPFQRNLMNRPDAEALVRRVDRLVKAFGEYKVPVVTVVTDDIEAITKTFQRVNSQGTVMSEVHMISALTWSKDFDLNEQIAALNEEYLAPLGWAELDDEIILRACKLALGLHIYSKNVDQISEKLQRGSQVFEEVAQALITAIGFLDQACGIRSPRALPYPSHLVPLIEALRREPSRVEPPARASLVKWFWTLAYSTRRSSPERQLELLEQMSKSGSAGPSLSLRSGRLDPLPGVFNFRSARCRTLALRMAERAGTDGVDALALHGSDAVPYFLYGTMQVPQDQFLSAANRIVVDPTRASEERRLLRVACRKKARTKDDLAILERHVVSLEAASALAVEDLTLFYRSRLRALEELENDFARRMGLIP